VTTLNAASQKFAVSALSITTAPVWLTCLSTMSLVHLIRFRKDEKQHQEDAQLSVNIFLYIHEKAKECLGGILRSLKRMKKSNNYDKTFIVFYFDCCTNPLFTAY
jgi:hypothetical protein